MVVGVKFHQLEEESRGGAERATEMVLVAKVEVKGRWAWSRWLG